MSVRVYLDPHGNRSNHRAHTFCPGDAVAGKVILSLSKDEEIASVIVEFKGKVHTQEGQGRDENLHENMLFSMRKTLFQGPFKMRKDKYEYPFSFKFPETWSHKIMEFREERSFAALGSGIGVFPLPPSCQDDGFQGACEIYYRITASVPRNFSDWEDKISLNFSPFRLELSPSPEFKTRVVRDQQHRNFRLGDDGRPRELSKREVIKHGFHRSSDTYTINFTLSATVPTRIVLGQAYPVVLTLLSKDKGLEGIEPDFMLKSYELRLKAKTEIRVPGLLIDHLEYLESHVPLSMGGLNAQISVDETKRIQDMFPPTQRFGPPPSFTTLAIKRSYGLELKVVVACLGEESTFKVEWPNVELLAEKMEGIVEDAIREIESGVGGLGVDGSGEGSALPAYGGIASSRSGEEELPGYETSVKN